MTRTYICIMCPNGCEVTAEYEGSEVFSVTGHTCPKGEEYVRRELTCPMRNIATSVRVEGGELPLVSVRLTAPIPLEKVKSAVPEIHRAVLSAPVRCGDIVVHDLLGLGVDVMATKDVEKA